MSIDTYRTPSRPQRVEGPRLLDSQIPGFYDVEDEEVEAEPMTADELARMWEWNTACTCVCCGVDEWHRNGRSCPRSAS